MCPRHAPPFFTRNAVWQCSSTGGSVLGEKGGRPEKRGLGGKEKVKKLKRLVEAFFISWHTGRRWGYLDLYRQRSQFKVREVLQRYYSIGYRSCSTYRAQTRSGLLVISPNLHAVLGHFPLYPDSLSLHCLCAQEMRNKILRREAREETAEGMGE